MMFEEAHDKGSFILWQYFDANPVIDLAFGNVYGQMVQFLPHFSNLFRHLVDAFEMFYYYLEIIWLYISNFLGS